MQMRWIFKFRKKKKVTGITHTCFSNKSNSQKLETLILTEVNLMLACIIANRLKKKYHLLIIVSNP